MKNFVPLYLIAWVVFSLGVVACCSPLKQYRKTVSFLCCIAFAGLLFYINRRYPDQEETAAKITNQYGPSLVQNDGILGSVSIANSTLDTDGHPGINIVHQPPHGNLAKVSMNDVHVFEGSRTWERFIKGIEDHTGDANYIAVSVKVMRLQVQGELAQIPVSEEIKDLCRNQFSSVADIIGTHVKDEKKALEALRTSPPPCFKQR